MVDYHSYWEKCWHEENTTELDRYLECYRVVKREEIDIFKEHQLTKVCDAACGFGGYTLALAVNGFEVYGFDISNTAVEITKNGLKKYGIASENVKVASILDTGYEDTFFDGVIAHAVIDHLKKLDAVKALNELVRITREEGLIWMTFDIAEEEDFEEEFITHEDGTMEYIKGNRDGMLFHPYDWFEIDELLKGHDIVYRDKTKRERTVILKKH